MPSIITRERSWPMSLVAGKTRCSSASVANFAQGAMKGQWLLSRWGLRGQRVEQFGRSEALFPGLNDHLSFLDHVHEFDPNQGILGCIKRLKPQHRPCHPLDTSMILLHNIIEILDLADSDRGAVLLVVALDGRFIGRAAVNGDLLRHAVAADRLGQEAFGRLLVALLREEKVNRLPHFIDSTIEIAP